MTEFLVMTGIRKTYPGVVALAGVDFDLRESEVHVILGENGAGKSTLIKVLGGVVQPDAGEIRVEGREVRIRSPRDAIGLGIGMVHQHLLQVSSYSWRLITTPSRCSNVQLVPPGSSTTAFPPRS